MEKKKNVIEVEVKFNKDEFEKAIEKAYDKKKNSIKLDGFRAGKVPMDVYFKKFGKESLYMDAIDVLLPDAYDKALKGDIQPIIQPKVDLKDISDAGVTFLFTITTKPEVNVKKYTGLNVKKPVVKVTEKEVDEEINKMLERFTELASKEGAIINGDTAIIDFEGFKDGVAFDGGKGENYSLEIGSHTFIPGFEEQLVALKAGDEKDIKVTFPEDYAAADLKGKEVTFKIKIHEVKEKIKRSLDKEFFEDLGLPEVDTEEKLRAEVKENIKASKENEAENTYVDDILKKIGENTEVDIPEELIHEEIHAMMHRFEEQMKMQGITLDLYFQMTKTTAEDMEKQMEPEAKNHILYRFIIDYVKEKEKITVTKKEAEKELDEEAKKYNMKKDEFEKMYGDASMMQYELEVKKTLDFLKENN